MEEIGHSTEVGCRWKEIGTEVEASFGKVDTLGITCPATSEGGGEVGVPIDQL